MNTGGNFNQWRFVFLIYGPEVSSVKPVQLSILPSVPSRSAADGSETVMKGLTKSTVVTWVEGED